MRTLVLILAVLAVSPAAASAGPMAAAKHSRAALLSCDTEANAAVFRGTIRTYGGAASLQLRFTLQARVKGDFKRVVAPSFDEWLSSSPGKKGFVYDKGVQELGAGTVYRAVVRYRWRAADGHVLARALKVTRECVQPDDRANLRATHVSVRPGVSAGTRTYLVRVVNRGPVEAPASAVGLSVDGADVPVLTAGPVAPHSSTTVAFSAPRCSAGSSLAVTVDANGAVDERNETDNRLAVSCPRGPAAAAG